MQRTLAIVGGTGAAGFGLALRWAQAGERIVIGSRSAQKASEAADRVRAACPAADIRGAENSEAVRGAGVVVLTLPLVAQIDTLKSILDALEPGVVVVDTTVPLERALGGRLSQLLPLWDGSAAERAQRSLRDRASVVAAFHSLSASSLADLQTPLHSDTLVCGNDPAARAVVAELAEKIPGVRAVDAGLLENARYAEAVAALLIALNLRHKVRSSGLRITGLPGAEDE